jgi:integrase
MKRPKKNADGTGNVEQLPSGRWRVRVRVGGQSGRALPGTYETREEAEAVRLAAVRQLIDAGRAAVGGVTLRMFGPIAIDRWKLRGNRSTYDDRNMFAVHIATAHFAEWPIQNVRRADVKRWRDELVAKKAVRAITKGPKGARVIERIETERPLARQRIINVLSLLRRIFNEALEDDLIEANPALEVYAPKQRRTVDPWTYLTLDEQIALLRVVPERDRPLIGFMIGTGMREGEVYALRAEDVVVDGEHPEVVVRFGGRDEPPKNGKIRRVSLFGLGLESAVAAIVANDRQRNVHGLLFPGQRGGYRPKKKAPKGWASWLRAAGIDRPVRIHDLRHTCAAALVSGMWGRAWRLEEVRDQLGHSSIKVTERYAHLANTALRLAAQATPGPRKLMGPGKNR